MLLAGMLLVGSTAGADAATTWNNTTTIYACVNKVTKAVRIVLPGTAIPPARRASVW